MEKRHKRLFILCLFLVLTSGFFAIIGSNDLNSESKVGSESRTTPTTFQFVLTPNGLNPSPIEAGDYSAYVRARVQDQQSSRTVVRQQPGRNRVPSRTSQTRSGDYSAASAPSTNNDVWYRLAGCETGGTYDQVGYHYTGNGYYGFFQFTLGTWQSVGGSGIPTDYPYDTQRHFAEILQQRSGWGQWPYCSRKLGLR